MTDYGINADGAFPIRDRPAEVAHWAEKAREATEARNTAIKAWAADGGSLREIGRAAGLSPAGVKKILDR